MRESVLRWPQAVSIWQLKLKQDRRVLHSSRSSRIKTIHPSKDTSIKWSTLRDSKKALDNSITLCPFASQEHLAQDTWTVFQSPSKNWDEDVYLGKGIRESRGRNSACPMVNALISSFRKSAIMNSNCTRKWRLGEDMSRLSCKERAPLLPEKTTHGK